MRVILFAILFMVSLPAFAQGEVRYFETLSKLIQFNPMASATGPSAVYMVKKADNRDWGSPRVAIWTPLTNAVPNGTNVFASPFGGRWIFPDKDDPVQNSLWYGSSTNKWRIDNDGNLILGTTNVAGNLSLIWENMMTFARFGDLEEYSLIGHSHPVVDLSDTTELTRSIIRQPNTQNIREILELGPAATRGLGTNIGDVAYGLHNHDGLYDAKNTALYIFEDHASHTNPHPQYIPYSVSKPLGLSVLASEFRSNILSVIGSGWTLDSSLVLRGDGTWSTVPASGAATNGITEAPTNGLAYTRKNAAWTGLDVADLAGLSSYGRTFVTTSTGIVAATIIDSSAPGRALLTNSTAALQRTALGLGTVATLNVASSGDAAAGEAVKGNDTRLTDQRTPTAHTHPPSQIASVPSQTVIGRTNSGTGTAETISMQGLSVAMRAQGLGTGSVSSVALSAPSIFNVTGSPVTSSGTISMAMTSQQPNRFFAGPVSGIASDPSFRPINSADLPAGTWTSSNDGTGSGMDADLLDAQTGSFYLARANHTGTQPWSTITGTPRSLEEAGITNGVRSVSFTADNTPFTVLGSPITNSGTIQLVGFTQLEKRFYAGPISGTSPFGSPPTFRELVISDLPSGVLTNGSLINSDTLDSQDGSYYLNRTNHVGTQPFSTITSLPGNAIDHGITNVLLLTGGDVYGAINVAGTVTVTNGIRVTIPTRSESSMAPIGITVQKMDSPYVDSPYTNATRLSVRPNVLSRGWEIQNTSENFFTPTGGMVFRYRDSIGWSPWIGFVDQRSISNYMGSGRGWNSDLLDSQDGSFYLNRTNHTGTQPYTTITGLGTVATLNVASSGDAAAGEVVKGSDTRLTDPRAPTSHTHPVSQISDGGTFGRQLVQTAVRSNALALIGSSWSSDPSLVLRGDGSWSTVPASGAATNGITEAPTNGLAYTRKNAAWTGLDVADLAGLSTYGRTFVTTSTGIVSEMIADSSAPGRALLTNATTALQRTALGLGTVATLNVASSGDAAAGEVVKGNDTRLTNSRPPSAHAHVIADTTGLQAALDGKLSLSGGTLTGGVIGTSAYFTNGVRVETGRRDESTFESPLGLSTQVGLGDFDTYGWTHPYGSLFSVWQGPARSWQFINTSQSKMAYRVALTTNWTDWHTLLDETTGVLNSDFAAHTNLTAGAHGISSFGALLIDDANDAAARLTLGLGSSAVLNVASSGDATSSQVVKGNDTRLTNARVPSAHQHQVGDLTNLASKVVIGRISAGTGAAEQIPFTSLGTVTSVGLSAGAGWPFTVSGSPVTSNGTITISTPSIPANVVLASASSGPAAASASWRSLTVQDLPSSVWTSANDGSGSTMDSDFLDGVDGSFYLNRANHTGTQPFSSLTALPTTLAGHGILDGATDAELAAHAATTVGVHGISAYGSSLAGSASAPAARGILGLGTSATLNVAAFGDASSSEVVKGNDSRLYDARPPTAHNHDGLYDPLGTSATTIANHLAAADPHGQYVKEISGSAQNLAITGGTISGDVSAGVEALSSGGPHSFLMAESGSANMRRGTVAFVKGLMDYHAADIVDSGATGQQLLQAATPSAAGDVLGTGRSSALYLRGDMTWASIPSGPAATNGILDAPSNGSAYARKNAAWTALDIADVGGMTAYGKYFVEHVSNDTLALDLLSLVGPSPVTIDSPAKYTVRTDSSGGSTRHRLNLIGSPGITLSLSDDGADDESDVTVYLASRDYGDVTVAASGANMTINLGSVTHAKIQDQPASTLLGRGDSGSGHPQEVQLGSGLAMSGTTVSVDPSTFISGQVLYVSKQEVQLSGSELDDESWHSIAADAKPGTSKTIPANLLGAGTTIKIEASGTMAYGDNPSQCKMRVRVGGATIVIPFDEPFSNDSRSTVWNIEAKVIIKSSGPSGVARGVGYWDYAPLWTAGSFTGYNSARNTALPITGTINTTVPNDIGIDFFGSDVDGDGTQFNEMICESVIVTRY